LGKVHCLLGQVIAKSFLRRADFRASTPSVSHVFPGAHEESAEDASSVGHHEQGGEGQAAQGQQFTVVPTTK